VAASAGLSLIEELTIDKIGAHNVELADRFRAGLRQLGFEPVAGRSPIVSVPGAGNMAARLEQADVIASARGGGLRFAFHLYNSDDDVERALSALRAG
jgi:selenocysteine lyase/cysteine desulfurase